MILRDIGSESSTTGDLRGLFTENSTADADDPIVGGIVYCWLVMISNVLTIAGIISIIYRMKRKKVLAQAGETAVKHSVILPAYEMLLWLLAILFFLAALGNGLVLWSYADPLNTTKRNEFMHLQIQSVVFLAFYSLVPVLLIQRTVTMKAFRNTFLIVMPWLVFNCVMASLLVASYNCVYEVDREDIDEGGGEEGNKDLNPDGLPLCKDMPLEFPKGGELVFALSGPLPAFIFHLLCILGKIKSRIELRSRSAKLSTFFACIYSAVVLGVNMLAFLYNNVDEIFIHLMQVGSISLLVMNMIFPFAIYKSLIADTKYWRGLGKYNRGIGQNSFGDSGAGGEVGPVSISVASTNMQNMMNSHILVDFSHLKVGKRIGRGSTATVYKGEFKKQEVAIKVFIPPEITEDDVNSFSQEAGMAAGLIHKNIVKTIGICVRPPSIALVCEFCEHGSLGEFIRSPEIVEHANLLWKFRCAIDAVAAVQYLHSCNILHRDIKADNYFLDSKGTVKLGDFGESTLYERNAKRRRSVSSGSSGKKMTIVGTISNMAPEMINAQRRYTEAVDIYSLGVTLWEIWTSETPFKKFNQFQIYQMVGEDRVRPNFPDDMNEVYKQCVNAAWGQTATERPRAKTLLKALCMEHDRINGVLNKVVKKMKPKVRSGRDSSEIGKSTEEERSDSFEMAEEDELPKPLPLAFKMKSESDNSTLTSSITSPPTEMVAGRSNTLTVRFKLQNIGNSTKVGKSVKMYRKDGTGSIDSIASDLTEDDDLDVAIMIKAKSENLTVSLREYEETNLRKRGATSVDNPVQSSDLRKRFSDHKRSSVLYLTRIVSSVGEKMGKPPATRKRDDDIFDLDHVSEESLASASTASTSRMEEGVNFDDDLSDHETQRPISAPSNVENIEVELTGVAGGMARRGSNLV